jgi:uncharacterized membrane protein YhaH (DUF805 family)
MEYWMFFLFMIIVSIVASIIDTMLGFGTASSYSSATGAGAAFNSNGPVGTILSLAILIPSLAVSVRRLHDTDRTGWWIVLPVPFLIAALVFMGAALMSGLTGGSSAASGGGMMLGGIALLLTFVSCIVLLVFYCLDGTHGPNRFGPDPKDPTGAEDVAEVFN